MRLIALLLAIAPCFAAAETTRATFDIYVGGIRAGVVSVAGEERGGRYAVAGVLESVGVVGAFRHVKYDANARGRVAGSDFSPERYSETFQNGRDVDRKTMTYRRGVPTVAVEGGHDRDAHDLDPATQRGTIDPLTGIWGVLRDVPDAQACRFSGNLFDGARRARVVLAQPRRSAGSLTCAGEYRRVAGYDADDMAHPSYPFRLTYGPAGNGRWQVERIDMDTIFGRGAMIRR
jgi:hypothetical protein